MISRPLLRLYDSRPRLFVGLGFVLWILTTYALMYLLVFLFVNSNWTVRATALLPGLAVLALHTVVTLFLGDAWATRTGKLARENVVIRFLRNRD